MSDGGLPDRTELPFFAVLVAVVAGTLVAGLLLPSLADGANVNGQVAVSMVPLIAAIIVNDRIRRASWPRWQRLVLRIVLAISAILVCVEVLSGPYEPVTATGATVGRALAEGVGL